MIPKQTFFCALDVPWGKDLVGFAGCVEAIASWLKLHRIPWINSGIPQYHMAERPLWSVTSSHGAAWKFHATCPAYCLFNKLYWPRLFLAILDSGFLRTKHDYLSSYFFLMQPSFSIRPKLVWLYRDWLIGIRNISSRCHQPWPFDLCSREAKRLSQHEPTRLSQVFNLNGVGYRLAFALRNVSYCLPHGVYYPHQHSVDTPLCLPPRRRSYLVLLRAGIALSCGHPVGLSWLESNRVDLNLIKRKFSPNSSQVFHRLATSATWSQGFLLLCFRS